MIKKTAILIFSRTAACEATKKRLLGSHRRNEALVTAMIARTKKIAQASGLPVFFSAEADQREPSFGERITAAAQRVINRGFDQLIILGNDVPQLRVKDLLRAHAAMQQGSAVIGKDRHGGAYLIGLTAEQCNQRFSALPWQTKSLGASLAGFLSPATEAIALLPCESKKLLVLRSLRDLNGRVDLALLLGFLLKIATFRRLLVAKISPRFSLKLDFLDASLANTRPLRGPPVAS